MPFGQSPPAPMPFGQLHAQMPLGQSHAQMPLGQSHAQTPFGQQHPRRCRLASRTLRRRLASSTPRRCRLASRMRRCRLASRTKLKPIGHQFIAQTPLGQQQTEQTPPGQTHLIPHICIHIARVNYTCFSIMHFDLLLQALHSQITAATQGRRHHVAVAPVQGIATSLSPAVAVVPMPTRAVLSASQ